MRHSKKNNALKDIRNNAESIIKLLSISDSNSSQHFLGLLRRYIKTLDSSPEYAVQDILALFGGMGSFDDLLLYKDGRLLKEENSSLSVLKSKLFKSCCEYKEITNRAALEIYLLATYYK
jgi:hypothetical protein